ncbi:unnamed protein product [Arctogadus glacialis]
MSSLFEPENPRMKDLGTAIESMSPSVCGATPELRGCSQPPSAKCEVLPTSVRPPELGTCRAERRLMSVAEYAFFLIFRRGGYSVACLSTRRPSAGGFITAVLNTTRSIEFNNTPCDTQAHTHTLFKNHECLLELMLLIIISRRTGIYS